MQGMQVDLCTNTDKTPTAILPLCYLPNHLPIYDTADSAKNCSLISQKSRRILVVFIDHYTGWISIFAEGIVQLKTAVL